MSVFFHDKRAHVYCVDGSLNTDPHSIRFVERKESYLLTCLRIGCDETISRLIDCQKIDSACFSVFYTIVNQILVFGQWWKITKYIHSSPVLKYNSEVLELNLSISIFCHILLLLHYLSEGNTALFTPLKLFTAIVTVNNTFYMQNI